MNDSKMTEIYVITSVPCINFDLPETDFIFIYSLRDSSFPGLVT